MYVIKSEYLKKYLDKNSFKINFLCMKKTLVLIFVIFLLSSCQNEYLEFHKTRQIENTSNRTLEQPNFSFKDIEYLSWITLNKTPDLEFLDKLTTKIDQAKNKVYVEVYIFTEKRLKKALKDAKKRWLDVKVILEKNVYLAWNLNKDTFNELKNAWIEVIYSNPKNYALNHTKMMIIDDEVVISTWNYSYSTFKYNREFFISLKDESYKDIFLKIFENDFNWEKFEISRNNLVLSPFSSREKLEYLLKNAKKSIKIYSHNFWDESIKNILINQKQNNILVQIIFPDLKKVSSNKEIINELKSNKIDLNIINKPEIHAKTILIDDEYLYIWSINFSSYSIDKNREIWILIKNQEIINEFLDIFNDDFFK